MARSADPIKARTVAVRIVRTLRSAGHTALLAGGCVRDELLGLHPTDYDVATGATPPQVRRLFSSVHEVGEAFGVMLVTLDHTTVEVATFRTDGGYSDNRRPDAVTFADDKADALRRDFTINALFLDPAPPAGEAEQGAGFATSPLGGTVIDYVGGLDDLRAKVIRAVGDPDARLNEDHLRALRAVRFAARLGFTIDPATAHAIRNHAARLKGVSRERIGEELRRMLTHPAQGAPARAATLLQQLTLDAPTLDEPTSSAPPRTLDALEPRAPFAAALAAWIIDRHLLFKPTPSAAAPDPRPHVSRARAALCLTNIERDELLDTLACFNDLMRGWPTHPVARQKRWAARWGFTHALACMTPHHPAVASHAQNVLTALEQDGVGISPTPYVNGDDLISLGFRPGPVFKSLLERLYDEQLEGRLTSRQEGLELARVWGV